MQTMRDLKNILKKAEKVLQKLLIQPIVKGLLVLERWGFILTYRTKEYLSRVYSLLASTIEHLTHQGLFY